MDSQRPIPKTSSHSMASAVHDAIPAKVHCSLFALAVREVHHAFQAFCDQRDPCGNSLLTASLKLVESLTSFSVYFSMAVNRRLSSSNAAS